jgi:hypothetical protein
MVTLDGLRRLHDVEAEGAGCDDAGAEDAPS